MIYYKKKVRLQLQVSWGFSVWAQPNTRALKHGNHFQQTSEEMSQEMRQKDVQRDSKCEME